LTYPLARVVLAGKPELVRRGPLRPARVRDAEPAGDLGGDEERAIPTAALQGQRHLERGDAVRVGPRIHGRPRELRSFSVYREPTDGSAGLLIERPDEELVVRHLRHKDRVDDREGDLRDVLPAGAQEVVALWQRPVPSEAQ